MTEVAENVRQRLLLKHGRVATYVARDLISKSAGERIERVQDYAAACSTGFGTVQQALRFLTEAGAVSLEARGHKGTYIKALNFKLLWELGGLGNILGLMPLPYSRRYEGLATGLYECFRQQEVPFSLGYMRGARERLGILQRGQCSFVVLSRLSAEMLVDDYNVTIASSLGPNTYVGEHAILLAPGRKGGIVDGMRVGIDANSFDQHWLTKQECQGKDVQFVDISYTQLSAMLCEGKIDATVWNADELPREVGLTVVPLQTAAAGQIASRNTEAVLVVNRDRTDVARIVQQVVSPERVANVQSEVLAGQRFPSY